MGAVGQVSTSPCKHALISQLATCTHGPGNGCKEQAPLAAWHAEPPAVQLHACGESGQTAGSQQICMLKAGESAGAHREVDIDGSWCLKEGSNEPQGEGPTEA